MGYSNKTKNDTDNIFSLSSAYITLETKLGLKPTNRCAICLKSVSGMQFSQLKQDINNFLDASKEEFHLKFSLYTDKYGYLWVILNGKQIEDLLAAIISVTDTIEETGFSMQLLACVFEFGSGGGGYGERVQYLIYSFKRDKFYPFVPVDRNRRSNEDELKIMATIADEIPFERDLSFWYPLWDLPF